MVNNSKNTNILNKILEKDYDHFIDLSRKLGIETVLKTISESTQNTDINTQTGRNIIKSRDELLTRIAVQHRTIEE